MFIKNEKGAALVLVIVSLFVLSLLGATLVYVSGAEAKGVAQQQKQMQAYYLAWSGANALLDYITTNPDNLENMGDYVNQIIAAGESQSVIIDDVGRFNVQIVNNGGVLEIVSTGTVDGTSPKTITLSLHKNSGWVLPEFDTSVFAENTISLGKGTINGNVGTNSNADSSININHNHGKITGNIMVGVEADVDGAVTRPENVDGEITNLSEPREYLLPPFPDFPTATSSGTINNSNNASTTISGDSRYDRIQFGNNGKLTVNVSGDQYLRVDDLTFGNNGIIEVYGSGSLTIYVENDFSMGTTSQVNKDGDYLDLTIFYKGDSSVVFDNGTVFHGSIFAETADIQIDNGDSIEGLIITGGSTVNVRNNTEGAAVIYAPNSNVNFSENTSLHGSIIANNVTIPNNATVTNALPTEDEILLPQEEIVSFSPGIWK